MSNTVPKEIINKIKSGELSGFNSVPKHIEASISDVFIFDDNQALKIYKRDSEYFNTNVEDISHGEIRINFIRKDFAVNHRLNPDTYVTLKTLIVEDGLQLVDEIQGDDNLVIVMKAFDTDTLFTKVLCRNEVNSEVAHVIGQQVCQQRLDLRDFKIEENTRNWAELLLGRIQDIEKWPAYIPEFGQEFAEVAFKELYKSFADAQDLLDQTHLKDLYVSTDCLSENSYFAHGKLNFFDICHPQATWRTADFYFDLIRVGCDIYALAGKEAYDAYLSGVKSKSPTVLESKIERLYLYFSALVMNMYLYHRSSADASYLTIANRYFVFTKKLFLEK